MALKFYATEVNVVLTGEDSEAYEVRITLNDAPVAREQAGADVMFDEEGNSYVKVDGPRMYRLIALPEFEGHELKLSSNSNDFSVFAFTFGAYLNQPPA